ncbi:interactor of HORMAD1 protein 1 isoform X2 [Tupaia chinensis]|uniref:interactor of HORMAD1 protein 1 isoform X2 n=1 Tax=Tupaia chinensis TaxID=246437 RepID=UPI0003C8D8A1|nr:interactor of HORMAD1 protein 1 isoform X2 [Tupaia chinensis]
MNFNIWNSKDMLSIPSGSGTTKSSNWSNNQADYSSLSDSQFLFGSQFCPENSETLSAPLDFGAHSRHPKQSQQNPLDSEPSIFTKYQAKPQLFGGDTKDGGLFPLPLSIGKSKGLFEQFEEKKKKAKDKCDSENLHNFVSYVRESIHRLQTTVEKSEEHLSSRSQSILDSLETVTKTLQEIVRAQNDLAFRAVQDKGNMEQAILEIRKMFEAKQAEFIDMKSNLKHLEGLVTQQSQDFQQLCEQVGQLNVPSVLAELKQSMSVLLAPGNVKDSTSQTSPHLAHSLYFTRQENYTSGDAVTQPVQVPPAAWNPSVGSPGPGDLCAQGKEAKSNALREEATLSAVGLCEGHGCVRDKAVQTDCQDPITTNAGLKNHVSSLSGHRVHNDRELVSQGTSQQISLDLDNLEANIKNSCPKYQATTMFLCDPCEHQVTEQKVRTVGRRGKGRKEQPKKVKRGSLRARKQEQNPNKTCAFNSKYQSCQPPASGPQRSSLGQQEPLAQLLHLRNPRSPSRPACSALRGRVTPSKTGSASQRSLLQLNRSSSGNNSQLSRSSRGKHQMSWFSDPSLGSSEPPLCKEPGKTMLYDLGFDSSDDGF